MSVYPNFSPIAGGTMIFVSGPCTPIGIYFGNMILRFVCAIAQKEFIIISSVLILSPTSNPFIYVTPPVTQPGVFPIHIALPTPNSDTVTLRDKYIFYPNPIIYNLLPRTLSEQ
jgi:hypothetical protein